MSIHSLTTQDRCEMNNKEVIDNMVKYFLTQDSEQVAQLCANLMLDIHRIVNFDALEEREEECLKIRMEKNSREYVRFAKHGPDGPLKIATVRSDEPGWRNKIT